MDLNTKNPHMIIIVIKNKNHRKVTILGNYTLVSAFLAVSNS